MNFIVTHWASILAIAAGIHTAASVVFGAIHKPEAESKFENVWHYVQIALGLGSRLVASKTDDSAAK